MKRFILALLIYLAAFPALAAPTINEFYREFSGVDLLCGWDDSLSDGRCFKLGSGLTITDDTISASGGGGGSLVDGDYGDIVVGGSGTTLTIDTGVIVNADINASAAIDASKIADGTVSSTEFQYINSLTSNAQTQINAKQATLSGASLTAVTVATDDKVLIQDTSDSNNLKTVTTQSIADLHSDAVSSVNSQTGTVVLDPDDLDDTSTTNKFTTASDISKLAGIEAGAEVNNISDANATDLTDGGASTLHYHASDRDRANHTGTQTASTISDFDTEVSNNTDVAANTAARHAAATVLDSSEIDFTLTGQQITASLVTGSIDETKLDTSVNASLDLADSSIQSGDNISELTNDSGFVTASSTTTFTNKSGNISQWTNDSGYITATLTQEQVEDYVGAMVSGNTETLITVSYQDADGTIDFVVDNDLANYSNATSGFITSAALSPYLTSATAASTYVPLTRTVNGLALSSNITLDPDDLDDTSTTNKFVTASDLTNLSNLSGTNTGDQDLSGYLLSATAASTYQPLDSDLTTIAGLTATTDNFIVSVSSAWASRTPAQVRTTLGLVVGTDVQAWDADLDAISALSGTSTIYYRSGANTWSAVTVGSTLSFSAGTLSLNLNNANTWTADQSVPDEAYDATNWNGSTEVPTKNAVRDQFESLSSGGWTCQSAQTTTSGTAINFTSIPSTINQMVITFAGVSTNGSQYWIAQLGDSGGYETTGYTGGGAGGAGGHNETTGLPLTSEGGASYIWHGDITITRVTGNQWASTAMLGRSDGANASFGGGSKTTSATTDRVRVTNKGSDTFDAGTMNICYQ